jgi:hypothetical protein
MRSTSAPKAASIRVPTGPAITLVKSSTRSPDAGNGPEGGSGAAAPSGSVTTSGLVVAARPGPLRYHSRGVRAATARPPAAKTRASICCDDCAASAAASDGAISASGRSGRPNASRSAARCHG